MTSPARRTGLGVSAKSTSPVYAKTITNGMSIQAALPPEPRSLGSIDMLEELSNLYDLRPKPKTIANGYVPQVASMPAALPLEPRAVGSTDMLDELSSRYDLSNAKYIGQGSFADVILARSHDDHRSVAVKVCSLSQHDDYERLMKEVAVLQEVSPHPNIVSFIDLTQASSALPLISREGPFLCIVMEYVSCAPLSQHIYHIGDLRGTPQHDNSWVHQFASSVMGNVASALSYMHRRGYVHRDVWSENILAERNGHTKLCDFGSSERYDTPVAVRGKLNIPYMSPAAWTGAKQHPGDDCWALGLVLSEVVTGRLLNQRLNGDTMSPIHTKPSTLAGLKQDVLSLNPILGPLVDRIVHDYQTLDLKDVSSELELAKSQRADTRKVGATKVAKAPSSLTSSSTIAPSSSSDALSHSISSARVTSTAQVSRGSIVSTPQPETGPTPQPVFAGGFIPGQRIKYLARSNGVWYPGVLVGRLPSNTGWSAWLDCGQAKEVDDSEAFRLSKT